MTRRLSPTKTSSSSYWPPTNVTINRTQATGNILNDDARFSVNDVTVVAPQSGTTNAVFTVSMVGVIDVPVTIDYATADVTAHGGNDYHPVFGTLTFPRGTASENITVPIVGHSYFEETLTFDLDISNPSHGLVTKGTGVGTILNGNPIPDFYVNDVQVQTNQASITNAVFSVALDRVPGVPTTVQYATADDTAIAGIDYAAKSGTLTFAPGVTSQFVTVPVFTSSTYHPNEDFFLNLFNPTEADLGDPQGVATIIFGSPPPAQFIIDDGGPGYAQTSGWSERHQHAGLRSRL